MVVPDHGVIAEQGRHLGVPDARGGGQRVRHHHHGPIEGSLDPMMQVEPRHVWSLRSRIEHHTRPRERLAPGSSLDALIRRERNFF